MVPGADPRYRALTVGRHLLAAMRERLDEKPPQDAAGQDPAAAGAADKLNVLSALELDQPMTKDEYEKELEKWQGRLNLASRDPRFKTTSVVAVFEGNDAAGKGGAIRRVTRRWMRAATTTSRSRRRPRRSARSPTCGGSGAICRGTAASRSSTAPGTGACWSSGSKASARKPTGCAPTARSTISRIACSRHGTVVVKFWLAISKEEQFRRFKQREKVAFKRFKITEEDWRNRKKWDAYETAVCDMVDRTSTAAAPWTLVEANNKLFARIKVLKTLCAALDQAIERTNPPAGQRR